MSRSKKSLLLWFGLAIAATQLGGMLIEAFHTYRPTVAEGLKARETGIRAYARTTESQFD